MRLHLGCGDKFWPGFVNIDFNSGDEHCDIRKLNYPDNIADEIHLIHVFEHLDRMDAEPALREWFRVLKPGGLLAIEVPCLDKISKMICEGEKNFTMTLFGLYGDVRLGRPEMLHKWCWSEEEMSRILKDCGFVNVEIQPPFFHFQQRDMRAIALKP